MARNDLRARGGLGGVRSAPTNFKYRAKFHVFKAKSEGIMKEGKTNQNKTKESAREMLERFKLLNSFPLQN